MRRETQNILLVLLGGALLKIALNGTYLNYVKPGLQPWLILSGGIMVLLAGVAIVTDILKARRAHADPATSTASVSLAADPAVASSLAADGVSAAATATAIAPDRELAPAHAGGSESHSHPPSHSHDDGHGHAHGAARSAWMLLMPVLAIFLIAPPALGADSVNRAGGRTVASEQRQDQVIKTKFPPLPAGSVVPMRMADVATRAAWDSTNSLDGRTLELTGFVVHDAAGVYVARLVITCCAADAMPVKARLVGAEGLADDEWITVTGQVRPNSAVQADNYVPVFDVTTVKKIGTPSDPYEY
ncbi:TIGR03943 family putative permease subunit [Kutzneria sp. CA-103260]|uniref:TIGR03943 family putative permease subunit n=1 Tax=Kutzneria sp. CA-103260 TaxID=2802641 RepID=UPI001BA64F57|nr:TIGR03943 family protein [Kutzneria sp. CA-103260]QUQ67987.1 TIGR03943 family protein [Kutzneria sp. CA-103260]